MPLLDLQRTLIWLGVVLLAGIAGEIHGCSRAGADYKEAEVRFITRVEKVKEIETVEVPIFKERIKFIDRIETKYIEAAKNETPNIASCDLSDTRVHRISEAATTFTR